LSPSFPCFPTFLFSCLVSLVAFLPFPLPSCCSFSSLSAPSYTNAEDLCSRFCRHTPGCWVPRVSAACHVRVSRNSKNCLRTLRFKDIPTALYSYIRADI
jgi:hypothetical protein